MKEFLVGIVILCAYFIVCATVAVIFRKTVKIPDEVFRKILHFILLTSLFVFVYAYDTWWLSVLTCVFIIVVAYPILYFFERFSSYSKTVTERKKGELRSSLIIVFVMFATIITVCHGLIGNRQLSFAIIYSWGYGDAAAALAGTKFGKHKIYKKKTLEGTLAMFTTSFFVVALILFLLNIVAWYGVIVTALVTSLSVAAVELYTPNGLDTVTCPFAALAVTIPVLWLFGGVL